MFGRIFGRGKDDQDQAVCVQCGRTLLAGEWTQTVVDDLGQERLICSLCGQTRVDVGPDSMPAGPAPANHGRVRQTRSEVPSRGASDLPDAAPATRDSHADSDAFWQALKDKDAEIEDLQARLARAEAERQELAGRFARLGTAETEPAAFAASGAAPATPVVEPPSALTGDSSEPGERTWGETPAEFATELAALDDQQQGAPAPVAAPVETDAATEAPPEVPETGMPAEEPPAIVFEDTQPIAMSPDTEDDDDDASTGEIAAGKAAEAAASAGGELADEPADSPAPIIVKDEAAAGADAAAASLTLLQRGVDLLNVSRVPRKIAETNEQLGLPHVHVGFDGQTVAVTFLWTMGWYRFHVDIDSGDVTMNDRGYEERADMRPNAAVRADGTVQLAPAQISRAAAHRAQGQSEAAAPVSPSAGASSPGGTEPRPAPAPIERETPRVAAQKPPEILSKSLLGQRSDDESASWEKTEARDFDWDR